MQAAQETDVSEIANAKIEFAAEEFAPESIQYHTELVCYRI